MDYRGIIALWDTPDQLAAEIGAGMWRVRKWRQRNSIPPTWWTKIIATETAKRANLKIEDMAKIASGHSVPTRIQVQVCS